MNLKYRLANVNDAEILIEIYNSAFYSDYIRYGECPAYGRTKERMIESINQTEKHIVYAGNIPAAVISLANKGNGDYYLSCLCVVPIYQHQGIGSEAIKYALAYYKNWRTIALVTPEDKKENIDFYTKKCGFKIVGSEMDGNVKVFQFLLER